MFRTYSKQKIEHSPISDGGDQTPLIRRTGDMWRFYQWLFVNQCLGRGAAEPPEASTWPNCSSSTQGTYSSSAACSSCPSSTCTWSSFPSCNCSPPPSAPAPHRQNLTRSHLANNTIKCYTHWRNQYTWVALKHKWYIPHLSEMQGDAPVPQGVRSSKAAPSCGCSKHCHRKVSPWAPGTPSQPASSS